MKVRPLPVAQPADPCGARIAAVLCEVARERGDERPAPLVLASPPDAAAALLQGWVGSRGAVLHEPPAAREASEGAAGASQGGDGGAEDDVAWEEAWFAAARRAARSGSGRCAGGVLVSTHDKTRLLLDPHAPPADVHPLGDLWASEVRALCGRSRLSPALRALVDAPPELEVVERVLRAWLEEGHALDRALATAPARARARLERLLHRPLSGCRPAVVPRLTEWTAGVDPPR